MLELDVIARRARRQTGSCHYFSPGYCPPLRWAGPVAFTVHDLIHLDVAGERSGIKHAYYERVVKPAAKRANVVFTVSEFSRTRILEWAGIPSEQVVVAGNGVDDAYFEVGPGATLGRPFILHVGNHKPHKNLSRLIAAFAMLADDDVLLALTGDSDPALMGVARDCGVADRVRFLGRVPEADLPSFYRGAAALAIPSLYEGFGLPALEGMAAGRPVVASDRTALPEVVGNAGIMVDPTDVESIAQGLSVAISDSAAIQRSSHLGPRRARRFGWNEVADRVNTNFGLGMRE
jgi:glycosyltransferase involved in cell wall biosynthesis